MVKTVSLIALDGVPLITKGADLVAVIGGALKLSGVSLQDGDILVIAQKIVSKAEGCLRHLNDVQPSARAIELAQRCEKDPRLVELILSESTRVMRVRPGVLIVRHRLGLVLANAGIDQSNVDHAGGPVALLLPPDPDATCRSLRSRLQELVGCQIGVMVIDSLGRAWRNGTTGTAIGVAGIPALLDLRGRLDIHGRMLQTTELGWADEVAAAASLMMGQANEQRPVVLVRGIGCGTASGAAADLIRPAASDLFQ